MKIPFMGRASFGNNNTTLRASPFGFSGTGTIDTVAVVCPEAGTVPEFNASLSAALSAGQTTTIDLYKIQASDSSTVLMASVGILPADGTNKVTGTVIDGSLAAGDRVYVQRSASGTPAALDGIWAWVWSGTATGKAWLGSGFGSGPSTTVTSYYPVYGTSTQVTVLASHQVLPTFNITITDLYMVTTNFVGGQFVVGLYIDGILQDGSGGTAGSVDTRKTITANGASNSTGISIAVSATSTLLWGIVPSSSPSANTRINFGIAYTPQADGLSFHAFQSQTNIGTALTFFAPGGEIGHAEASTGLTNWTALAFTTGRLGRNLPTATGTGGRTRTFSVRKNGAEFSTPITTTVTNTGGATGVVSFTQQAVAVTDVLTLKSDVSGTAPNNSRATLTNDIYVAPEVLSPRPFLVGQAINRAATY